MAEPTERVVLNRLIERCRDAERGFRLAAAEAEDPDLRQRLERLANERHRFAEQLLPHAYRLGGESTGHGSRLAALHRGWMLLRSDLAVTHDRALLEEAARGERFAAAAYDQAAHALMMPDARELVATQEVSVRATRDELDAALHAAYN